MSHAQQATPPDPNAAPAAVGEVVVIAEKREQRLEKVGQAISAYGAQQRDQLGIKSVQDMTNFTPGLAYNAITNRPYLRGIGRNTDNLATESAVATYVDGVYDGANASTLLQPDSLFVDRVEVERGPQNTLHGSNSDGGVINFIYKRPTRELQGEVRGGYANYDKYFYEAAISGPITDNLRFRLGGNRTVQTGGYFKNLNGGEEGGSVAQGNLGTSYYIEGQVEGNIGDKFDFWGKASTGDFRATYRTQAAVGTLTDYEFPSGFQTPNPFYGICGLDGGTGVGCATPGTEGSVVPGSVVTQQNVAFTNPTATNIRNYIQDRLGTNDQTRDKSIAWTAKYHMDGMDLVYLGGYQSFYYNLEIPSVYGSGVESYQLQGPTGLGNLTINPRGIYTAFIEDESFFSHEINLISTKSGPVQWVAGLYWLHEHYNQPVDVEVEPYQTQMLTPVDYATGAAAPLNPDMAAISWDTDLTYNSYAAFAQADWEVTPTIKLTGGVRYTEDKKSGYEQARYLQLATPTATALGYGLNNFGANTPAVDITALAVSHAATPGAGTATLDPSTGFWVRSLDASWGAWTGTAAVNWTPNQGTLIYAKYTRGYKTGGFNSGSIAAVAETQPEYVDAFEIGNKEVIGSNIQINSTAFYYNYQNDQQPLSVFNAGSGAIVNQIFNIPVVHTYGFELEALWRPVPELTLGLNYAYLHARVASALCVEDTIDPFGAQPGANTAGCPVSAPGAAVLQNLKGQTLPLSAPNKVSFNAAYTLNTEPGKFVFSGAVVWKDSTYGGIFNRPYDLSKSYTQVNLRVAFTDAKDRFSVIAFCDNLFNTVGSDGAAGVLLSPTTANPSAIITDYGLTAPRTYGMEVQFRFR